jgi:hypothetical protein
MVPFVSAAPFDLLVNVFELPFGAVDDHGFEFIVHNVLVKRRGEAVSGLGP